MSTIRSVLLHLDATPASAARLEFARSFALRHDAALSAMFVACRPQRPVPPAFSESPAALLPPMDWAAVDRAKSLFDNVLADGGPPMRWLESSDAGLDIAQYLQSHGIVPALHRHHASPADAGEVLLSFATEVGADLLVIGCYGHGRARESIPGGASRSVLQTMTLPVLMAH